MIGPLARCRPKSGCRRGEAASELSAPRIARDVGIFRVAEHHAGHGVNSYAINYFLTYRAVALYTQVLWGGSYTDTERATAQVAPLFSACATLIEAAEAHKPEADTRLLCVASDFRPTTTVGWIQLPYQLPPRHRDTDPTRLPGRPSDALLTAVELLRAAHCRPAPTQAARDNPSALSHTIRPDRKNRRTPLCVRGGPSGTVAMTCHRAGCSSTT